VSIVYCRDIEMRVERRLGGADGGGERLLMQGSRALGVGCGREELIWFGFPGQPMAIVVGINYDGSMVRGGQFRGVQRWMTGARSSNDVSGTL
jgi:hypothetical protein